MVSNEALSESGSDFNIVIQMSAYEWPTPLKERKTEKLHAMHVKEWIKPNYFEW